MKKIGIVIILLVVVGRTTIGAEITSSNDHIKMPHYSIAIPAKHGWQVQKPGGKAEKVILTDRLNKIDFQIVIARNVILDANMRKKSAKFIADDFRKLEKQIMIEQGVNKGLYKLSGVRMGVEEIENRYFYTMRYKTRDKGGITNSTLYLYFPVAKKNQQFIAVHSSVRSTDDTVASIPVLSSILKSLSLSDSGKAQTLLWPLHSAVVKGDLDKIKQLSAKNANFNEKDIVFGFTPLHWAAIHDNVAIAELLIMKGANVNAISEKGMTPLDRAAYKGSLDVAKLLIAKGADVNAKATNENITPLHQAAANGHTALAELLIDNGAKINAKAAKGITPLHFSAYHGKLGVTKLLLKKGANINAKAKGGLTPLKFAIRKGHSSVAELLREQSEEE